MSETETATGSRELRDPDRPCEHGNYKPHTVGFPISWTCLGGELVLLNTVPWCVVHDSTYYPADDGCGLGIETATACRVEDPPKHWVETGDGGDE